MYSGLKPDSSPRRESKHSLIHSFILQLFCGEPVFDEYGQIISYQLGSRKVFL